MKRKSLLRTFSILYSLAAIVFCCNTPANAQQILSVQEMHGARNGSVSFLAGNSVVGVDNAGNIYFRAGLRTYEEGLQVDGKLIPGSQEDFGGYDWDEYLLKYTPEHELAASTVIKNREPITDIYPHENGLVVGMNFSSQFQDTTQPVIIGDHQIERKPGRAGKGALILFDRHLDLDTVLMPTTGQIGQIAVQDDRLFMEILIPQDEAFILLGQDTVFNFTWKPFGELKPALQTIVLCSYDLTSHTFRWWQRIGGPGDEKLNDLQLSAGGRLILLGQSNSTYLTFNGTDTLTAYGMDEPFLAKFSTDGVYVWGLRTPEAISDRYSSISVDSANDIYVRGYYFRPEIQIGDTVLHNPGGGFHRSIIVKYSPDGSFQWVKQMDGANEFSNFIYCAAEDPGHLWITASFFNGQLQIQDSLYFNHTDSSDNAIILKVDKKTGKTLEHYWMDGPGSRAFRFIYPHQNGQLTALLLFSGEDQFFGSTLSSFKRKTSIFLLKISTDLVSTFIYKKQNDDLFKVFPNPVLAGEIVHLQAGENFQQQEMNLSLIDQEGRTIWQAKIQSANQDIRLNSNELSAGLYFLVGHTKSNFKYQAVIIQ